MRYWYDTEFHEDGKTIDLISIGIVAEDGREYYAVNRDADWGRIAGHEWLAENVVPHLPDMSHESVKPHAMIADEVMRFIDPDPEDYRRTELWAWCAAYDHVALMQIYGPMQSVHGTGLPFYTHDLKSIHDLFLTDDERTKLRFLPFEGDAHNALDDARQLRDRWEFVNGLFPLT